MKKMAFLASLIVVLIGYACVQPLLAQTPARRPQPAREALDAAQGWPHQPESLSREQSADRLVAPTAPTASNTWSKIVYQNFANNWDVYIMNGDGSNPTRLTTSGSTNTTPRLNRGATRIVFGSNETGNYDIFVMNVDGSGRGRLTSNRGNDYNPAWSPDSGQIVFNSYRDGQSEVYRMDADGRNQTRLTNSPGYDGEPVWSPDGSKIAFVSIRESGQQIYTMNSDGSHVTRLTLADYAEFPSWSPDGSQIAFSADSNGDGFLELALINADGRNQHFVYSTGTQADFWAHGWSPDGRSVVGTLIGFVNYQGNWYWTEAHVATFDVTTNQLALLGSSNVAWHPDWQSTDLLPPSSSMSALPVTSPSPIVVHWNGSDAGASGIQGYDVQVKEGAGAWTMWLTRTATTSAAYPGIGGHTYAFRVRAVDNSFNAEAWPAAAQASTTVEALPPVSTVYQLPEYWRGDLTVNWGGSDPGGSGIATYDVQYQDTTNGTWIDWKMNTAATSAAYSGFPGHTYAFRLRARDRAQNLGEWSDTANAPSTTYYLHAIEGAVYDNRSRPVSDAIIASAPAALNTAKTQVRGTYDIYAADSVTRALTVTKSGYGTAAAMTLSLVSDVFPLHILPPLDDVIQGGEFESAALTDQWQVSGLPLPKLSKTVNHTGRQAVQLGTPFAIDAAQNIYQSPWNAFVPSLSVDNNRTTHLVVTLSDASGNVFYYANKPVTGTWPISLTTLFTDDTAGIFTAPDNEGGVYIVWNSQDQYNYTGIYYCHKLVGVDACSTPENLSTNNPGIMASQLIRDDAGGLHVVGNNGADQIVYLYRSPQGVWNPVQFTMLSGLQPGVAVDRLGNVHLVWETSTNDAHYVLYSVKAQGGTWSAPVTLGESDAWPEPAIVVEEDGTLHVLYHGFQQLNYLAKSPLGSWSAPVPLSQPQETFFSSFHLAIDAAGTLHALLGTGAQYPASNQVYAIKPHGQDWYRPVQAVYTSSDILYSTLAVDASGVMHAMWSSWLAQPTYLTYAQTAVAPAEADLGVQQVITLPADLHRPVLSWLFSPTSPVLGDDTLSIRLDDGLTETEVYSVTPASNGWAPYWTDMSAWSGKTVTLSLQLHQAAGNPFIQGYLDEVSLGSWLTPDPQAVTPHQIEATAATVITITGDNFIAPIQVRLNDTPLPDATWINTHTITATVPVLPPGRYDVIVTNAGGQASGLANALLVGYEVYLPLIQR